jgi:hypothetical protein
MNKELIERMKQNRVPYGLLMPEERDSLIFNFNYVEIFIWDKDKGCYWAPACSFQEQYTYRIRPDYQPEPEVKAIASNTIIKVGDIVKAECMQGQSLISGHAEVIDCPSPQSDYWVFKCLNTGNICMTNERITIYKKAGE